jgi:hypothetical protein
MSLSLELIVYQHDRPKTKAHCIRQMQSVGEAICGHYSHILELMDTLYPEGYPEMYNPAFIQRMQFFASESSSNHLSSDFIANLQPLARVNKISFPDLFG